MVSRLTEAPEYRHSWESEPVAGLLDQEARRRSWLQILVALAQSQAELGIIPTQAGDDIAQHADPSQLDVELVAARTRATSHSTLGLIEALTALLPERSREYVYYGATVQDLTDTWFALVMRDTSALVRHDLGRLRTACARLALEHRSTPMAGRTHGQPGTPISFGLKAATWADEIDRSLERLAQGTPRWSTVQLAGSTGGLAFFGDAGPALRAAFAARLGLADPGISWTSSRDRTAEFGTTMALVTGALARIGDEVYELQRPELGELGEPLDAAVVGSITMPHKRNPEYSEHLCTLARLVRAAAGVLLEGLVSAHERDGRAWKAEWAALPDVALFSSRSAQLAAELVEGLRVDPAAMARNLGPGAGSEAVLVQLSRRLGKHRAQALLQDVLGGRGPSESVEEIAAAAGVPTEEVASWLDGRPLGSAASMVDHVVARGVAR